MFGFRIVILFTINQITQLYVGITYSKVARDVPIGVNVTADLRPVKQTIQYHMKHTIKGFGVSNNVYVFIFYFLLLFRT